MAKAKWKTIPGCDNYAIGSNGKVKRLKHRSTGKLYRILDEMIVEPQMNRSKVVYVKIRTNEGGQKVFSVQKLFMETFLEKGTTYYKLTPDPFVNRLDVYLPSYLFERMKHKPIIYKTINT